MTEIIAATIQVKPRKWIGIASNIEDEELVACTTPMDSKEVANSYILASIRRFHLLKWLSQSPPSKSLDRVAQRLWQLFHGKGEEFNLNEISQKGWSPARTKISNCLLQVPLGKVITYGGLAKRARSSPRGVGSVMASNPVPLAIPCHRVILADGRLGKFGRSTSGTRVKAVILRAEGVPFRDEEYVEQDSIIE
jgi:methylated-DNA-[protein]-cysteine S-methyltransferase